MGKLIPVALRYFLSVLVLTVFRSADVPCTSTVKCEHSVHLLLDVYVPHVSRKSWTFHTSPVKCG